MKKLFWILLIILSSFLTSCKTQVTPDVNSTALTAAAIVWTADAQTMEAIPTSTPVPSETPTPLFTPTLVPTLTPFTYIISDNVTNTCSQIAFKFEVSVKSIIDLNDESTCFEGPLPIGKVLQIPYPTPTPGILP